MKTADVPWYEPIDPYRAWRPWRDFWSFKTTIWGRAITHYLVWALETVGIAPREHGRQRVPQEGRRQPRRGRQGGHSPSCTTPRLSSPSKRRRESEREKESEFSGDAGRVRERRSFQLLITPRSRFPLLFPRPDGPRRSSHGTVVFVGAKFPRGSLGTAHQVRDGHDRDAHEEPEKRLPRDGILRPIVVRHVLEWGREEVGGGRKGGREGRCLRGEEVTRWETTGGRVGKFGRAPRRSLPRRTCRCGEGCRCRR